MTTTTITGAGAHASAATDDRIPALKTPFTPGTKGYLTPDQIVQRGVTANIAQAHAAILDDLVTDSGIDGFVVFRNGSSLTRELYGSGGIGVLYGDGHDADPVISITDAQLVALLGLSPSDGDLIEWDSASACSVVNKNALAITSTSGTEKTLAAWTDRIQRGRYVASLAAMKLLNGADLANGDIVVTIGRTTAGIGGGSYVYLSANAETADDGMIVSPADAVGRFVSKRWVDENLLEVCLYGMSPSSSGATNQIALNNALNYMEASTEGGIAVLPQGSIALTWDTARTLNLLRAWKIRGVASQVLYNVGTQLNITGGAADRFLSFSSDLDLVFEDLNIHLNRAGFNYSIEVTAGDYYAGDGVTPVDTTQLSSYHVKFNRCLFTANVASGFDPAIAQIWPHSAVMLLLDSCWITNCNRAFKLGNTSTLDTQKLAKGTTGQVLALNCYTEGDFLWVRGEGIYYLGGQITKQTGTGAASRCAKFVADTGAQDLDNVTFDTTLIGYAGDHSDCFVDGANIYNFVVRGCSIGEYSDFMKPSGNSAGWKVEHCTHRLNGGDLIEIAADGVADAYFEAHAIYPHPSGSPTFGALVNDLRRLAPTDTGRRPAGRNYAVNPRFQHWQRGTSFVPGATMSMADGWRGRRAGNVAGSTYARATGFSGATYCMRVQRDSGDSATGVLYASHQIASVDCIALQGKTIRVSADIRSGADFSAASSNILCTIHTGTGTNEVVSASAGFATGNVTTTGSVRAITTTATRYQFDIHAVPSTATEIAVVLRYTPVGTASTNDYFEFTNVKIEVVNPLWTSATDYQTPEPISEFCYCQRRYEKSFLAATTPAQNVGTNTGEMSFIATIAGANTNRSHDYRYVEPKELTGTLTLYNTSASNAQIRDVTAAADTSSAAAANSTEKGFRLTCEGNASTAVGNVLAFHYSWDAAIG